MLNIDEKVYDADGNELAVAWHYLPHTSQYHVLRSHADHLLYTGSRGPGKTDSQLMAFRDLVGQGYGSYWRGIIFDREYKNLDDLVLKSKRWFYRDGGGGRFLESKGDYKWIWPDGEELLFRTAKTPDDYFSYHGQEFPFIGWNELCKFPSRQLYDDMMSCNRSSFIPEKDTPTAARLDKRERVVWDRDAGILPPRIPLRVFSTTNSYGPGHSWVKRQFIDPVPYGCVLRWTTQVFNPQTQRVENIVKSQITYFGLYKENPYLDPKYIAELENIKDKNKRKAWLKGDWNIVAGGALDDVWDSDLHVKPRFVIPPGWHLDRSFDWGSSHPFAVTWFAEANGEEATLADGTKFCPPPGTLVCFGDLYGCNPDVSNEGLRLSPREVALRILAAEKQMLDDKWIMSKPRGGPADNQIRNVQRTDIETIAKSMEDAKVSWTESDKAPGSRKQGLMLLRERLQAARANERPAIYFMDNCRSTIATLPTLPRDEKDLDDVDTDAEDHLYDAVRYRVLRGNNRTPKKLPNFFGYGD